MKAKIFVLIALVLMFSLVNGFYPADYGKLLRISSVSTVPATIYPGDIVSLNVDLYNRGATTEVINLDAWLSLSDEFKAIDADYSLLGINTQSTQTLVFKFKVKESALPGTYQIPMRVRYQKSISTDIFIDDYNLLISVQGHRSLRITNIKVSDKAPHIGEKVLVSADIVNDGSLEARHVVVSLTPNYGTAFGNIVPLTETAVYLDNIPIIEKKPVSFSLFLSDKLEPKVYDFSLSVVALDFNAVEEETISFEVKGKPELVLSGVDFSIEGRPRDKKLMQGDSFSLSLQLDNIGKEQAKAVEIKLEADEGITGLKEAYVGNIDADDSSAGIFDLTVLPKARTGNHQARITVTYIDELGQKQTVSKDVDLYIHPMPPESPVIYIVALIIALFIVYLIVRQTLRYLAFKKRK